MKFKIGDWVKIKPESSYYGQDPANPANVKGKIVQIIRPHHRALNPILVKWDSWDQNNSYQEKDLIHIDLSILGELGD